MFANKKVKLISAVALNGVIGRSDTVGVLWQGLLPSDMKRFRDLTTIEDANSVVYGRKTWDSLPEKYRPLKDRQNVIVSRDSRLQIEHPLCLISDSVEEAIKKSVASTVWIIGGGEIYRQSWPYLDEMHITLVQGNFIGDIYFPNITQDWMLKERTESFGLHPDKICSSYLIYRRKNK